MIGVIANDLWVQPAWPCGKDIYWLIHNDMFIMLDACCAHTCAATFDLLEMWKNFLKYVPRVRIVLMF